MKYKSNDQDVKKITYMLWEDKENDRLSGGVCTLQAQSHTYYGKAKVVTGSVRGLHSPSTITYILWEGKGGDRISEEVCTLQAQSHTYCAKAKVVMGS